MTMPYKRPFKDKNQYYAYIWRYRGRVIYVGQGKNNRGRVGANKQGGSRHWKLAMFLDKNWEKVKVEFIACDSQQESRILEAKLIKKLKPKYNIATGYGGWKGMHTKEGLDNIRAAVTGVKWDDKRRQAMSNRLKGNKHLLGHKHSVKTRAKLSITSKGRKPSLLARQKSRERMIERNTNNPPRKGLKCSDEHKQKVALAHLGKKLSEVTKDKLRVAMLKRKRNSFGRII